MEAIKGYSDGRGQCGMGGAPGSWSASPDELGASVTSGLPDSLRMSILCVP